MTDDDKLTTEPTTDEDEVVQDLPPWITRALDSTRILPGASKRLALWLPTFNAAWRAGRSGIALGGAIRSEVASKEPLAWPAELAAEFTTTMVELKAELPAAQEFVPLAADIIDLTERFIDPDVAQSALMDTLARCEQVGERAIRVLLEAAFFAPQSPRIREQSHNLRRLFLRLEEHFDRALLVWLSRDKTSGTKP